jgi:hypothetical protein
MHVSTTLRAPSHVLSWSLATAEAAPAATGAALTLAYAVEALEELYIADVIWDYDANRRRVLDPYGVYRFVERDMLRLMFDRAPVRPDQELPREPFKPLYSRILSGETRAREIRVQLPVQEYSSLARNVAAPTQLEHVSLVQLVVAYRLRSTMTADPQPSAKSPVEEVGYIVHDPQHMVSSLEVVQLPVSRRLDPIGRPLLPGDEGWDQRRA